MISMVIPWFPMPLFLHMIDYYPHLSPIEFTLLVTGIPYQYSYWTPCDLLGLLVIAAENKPLSAIINKHHEHMNTTHIVGKFEVKNLSILLQLPLFVLCWLHAKPLQQGTEPKGWKMTGVPQSFWSFRTCIPLLMVHVVKTCLRLCFSESLSINESANWKNVSVIRLTYPRAGNCWWTCAGFFIGISEY